MERFFFIVGALSGLASVAAGAFGAHALRARLDASALAIFETGARYQFFHALALIATAWAIGRWPHPAASVAGWLFVGGSVLFCGSLYALALGGVRALGAITPFGGLMFMAGWLCLAIAAWRA